MNPILDSTSRELIFNDRTDNPRELIGIINGCKTLQRLDLSHLSTIVEFEFKGLKCAGHKFVVNDEFFDAIKEIATQLEALSIKSSLVTGVIFRNSFPNLVELYLGYSKLVEDERAICHIPVCCPRLTALDISNSSISAETLQQLSRLALEILILDNCPALSASQLGSLNTDFKLKHLSLKKSLNDKNINFLTLNPNTSITSLDLSMNMNLTGAYWISPSNLRSLKEICLDLTSFTPTSIERLTLCPHLTKISIQTVCSISQKALFALKSAKPRITFVED